jgi:hypothetical protein
MELETSINSKHTLSFKTGRIARPVFLYFRNSVKRAFFFFVFACWTATVWYGCTSKTNATGPIDTTAKQDTLTDTMPSDTVPRIFYTPPFAADTDFYPGDSIGALPINVLPEASGLAASRNYPGLLWTHNDSGNPPYIFLIDSFGHVVETFQLDGISNRDWEDIASGPGPTSGVNYVYVGEIGDNNAKHASSYIYRFPEPSGSIDSGSFQHITQFDKINFNYPDGPHDAETLMLDPLTLDLYVASKGTGSNLYLAKYPQQVGSLFTMTELANLPFYKMTAGDISADGSEILMKNDNTVYHWSRAAGQTILAAVSVPPTLPPYTSEAQGEAICWSIKDDAYFTTSEYTDGLIPPLHIYRRKK